MRANSRKTWQPTAPTYICEYGPQESWPLHCKQPSVSPFDEHAVWSYRQPNGTFLLQKPLTADHYLLSWPRFHYPLSLIVVHNCLVRTPDVTTAMPGQHVFQHLRQLSLRYLFYHLWYLISAFFYTHSTIFCEHTLSPQYDLIYNTDTHIKHEDRLWSFLVRQFVCRWQWNQWGTKKIALHHVMNTTNIHRQLTKVNIKERVY